MARFDASVSVSYCGGRRADFGETSQLNFEGWRAFLRGSCGKQPAVPYASAFAGWVRPLSVCGLAAAALKIECGLAAMDSGRNAYRSKRTHRDARFAGADYYYAVFQVAGQSVFTQNDEVSQLAVGDIALLDAARPAACFTDHSQWLRLQLPRRSLVSHLGCEPKGGSYARGGTPATHLLFDLVRDAAKGDGSASCTADSYMQLAVYDLLGALLAPSDPSHASGHADRLFALSGVSSRTASPIRISALTRSRPKRESRCVTFRSFLRRAVPPVANSYTRFVWITPRTYCIAGRRWEQ